jgi:hypothetical protein
MMKTLLSSALVASLLAGGTASPVTSAAQSPLAPSPTQTSFSFGITVTAPTYTPLSTSAIAALQQELLMAPSEQLRENILFQQGNNANNISFQFINQTAGPPVGGTIAVGSVNNVPGLIGTNVGFAIGFVDACGLNVPHLHPRANEFLTVVEGLLIGALVLEEDSPINGGLPVVEMTLTNYTGMLFPVGHVHWQFNPTCERAVFAAGFDSLDEGRTQIAQTFFSVTPDFVVETATGDQSFLGPAQIDQLRDNIPENFAQLVDSCAKACNLPTGSG